MKTIGRNATGSAVTDIQRRLRVLGYDLTVDGNYLDRTQAAVEAFREREGLPAGDFIDTAAWSALVDASFALGDRMLYLRMPYFHGRDVKDLQDILNVLGFVVGNADGIFGAHTEHALRDFQSSVGLNDDGVAGATTYDAIQRLRHAWEGKAAVTEDVNGHSGFARAAEALENFEACLFGLDERGRGIATRAANLARATTPFSRVNSADTLSVPPAEGTLMIGLGCEESLEDAAGPVVPFADDYTLAHKIRTAMTAMPAGTHRMAIELPEGAPEEMGEERWQQHVAIQLLDALCAAVSR